ncbi:hypothetical protein EEL32_16085 [Brevibacillus laterosporus]|uniref:Uncharacterized protein n=1 Tax=Brevibacillus laterosporus TaxID=1465 RepID=A0A502IDU0_BRELA|nr:hypothetical protein [Brevibacillus laterosporus]QDX92017.1 hypothetical protein EEL30_06335 [Brevibacillus laterosporus]TPG70391.1 hypothetical protein EEL31_19090 [Brevibacillus laterosporus]TPG84284.1 hypothetical protein EEL32_16085 [Brevibacillus laterosporus]
MIPYLSHLYLLGTTILLFISFLAVLLVMTKNVRIKPRYLSQTLWNRWRGTLEEENGEKWDELLQKAGHLLGWGKSEWIAMQYFGGLAIFLVLVVAKIIFFSSALSLFWIFVIPTIAYFIPYVLLKWWASHREDMLSQDIARFTNRYIALLENNVPAYSAMVKAARPTKHLKRYLPSLSEWNRDKVTALEQFKRDLGVEDAIILVSNMRTLEQMPATLLSQTMHRLEVTVDNRRMFRQRQRIKSLGMAYSLIVYPAFYIGLIVAMFPWYKFLSEILNKYLV